MNHPVATFGRMCIVLIALAVAAHGQESLPATARRLAAADSILSQLVSGTPQDISRRLGKPTSTVLEGTVNIHDGSLDTLVRITYQRASVRLYHDVQTGRYLPALLEISDVRPLESVGMDSLSSESDLVSLFGSPQQRKQGEDAVLIYAAGPEGQNTVEFHMCCGRVARVVYLPYLD